MSTPRLADVQSPAGDRDRYPMLAFWSAMNVARLNASHPPLVGHERFGQPLRPQISLMQVSM